MFGFELIHLVCKYESQCVRIKISLLDVDGCHVDEDTATEVLALVRHGAVLDGPVEDDYIACSAGHLDGVVEKFL